MPVTNYYSFGGSIVGEETVGGSGYRAYGTDALGSVVATYDDTGSLENQYRYSPYGQTILSDEVATTPRFTWVGALGYRQTMRHLPEFYVRSRHFTSLLARWTTLDPLWPTQGPYGYPCDPVGKADPSGKALSTAKCALAPSDPATACTALCNALYPPAAYGSVGSVSTVGFITGGPFHCCARGLGGVGCCDYSCKSCVCYNLYIGSLGSSGQKTYRGRTGVIVTSGVYAGSYAYCADAPFGSCVQIRE